MDLPAKVAQGLESIDADQAIKQVARKNLERWLTDPEFTPYRPQLDWLIQTEQWPGLLDRFYQILPFGTGGRRGAVGIGPNRMNRWTLGASVQGHCEYLKEKFPEIPQLKVTLAYDVRQFEDQRKQYNAALPNPVLHLSSKELARQAACIYTANGIEAWIQPENDSRYLATPELSFIIRRLGAHGGLNLSASHNPPDDNGGKFYDERGAQPVPPDDQIMADLVDQVLTIRTLPWADAVRSGKIHFLDDAPHKAYIELCRKQSLVPSPKLDEIQVVFTPLHGVGSMTAMEVLVQQGFRVIPVEEQMAPDGQFPNVTQSPNPEVPASLDRAEVLARQVGADLVLATDPDADRLGALAPVLPKKGQEPLEYRFLNGNTLSALVTHFKLEKLTEQGRLPDAPLVITTLVTTSLVTRIARSFQAQVVNNLLVGFKYMADVLWQLEQFGSFEDIRGTPEDFILATEESHGFMLTEKIRDKDAGAAALLLAELALDQKRQGRSVLQYLDVIERRFGYFRNHLRTIALAGIAGKQTMARMMDSLRKNPPQEIAGMKVTSIDDLLSEDCWLGPLKGATDRAARNVLHFRLGDSARIALRPSGTEPKAKAYLEVASAPCPAGASDKGWQHIKDQVDDQAQRLGEDFLKLALGTVGLKG